MEVCIVPDNISSMVHAYGLRLLMSEGWHPAYDYFCSRKEACVITMENLRGVIGAQASGGRVYIVENELVFSYLVERLKGGKHSESCPAEDGEARAGEGACGVSGKYAGGAGEGYWRDG